MHARLLLSFCLSLPALLAAQNTIHHWESPVLETDIWRYWEQPLAPASNWNQPTYNPPAPGWQSGQGGFGFGDGDDNTPTSTSALAVYVRTDFWIFDTASIVQAILSVDYDDGFVAYLNGVEIARRNISAPQPNHLTPADGEREAQLYQGGLPESFALTPAQLTALLRNGSNTLALEVHNWDMNSSDLSLRPFFSVGLSVPGQFYHNTPWWFVPPVELDSSNLPILRIETGGQTIEDEPDIQADLYVYNNPSAARNYLSDQPAFVGRINIEIRGQTSQFFPKKCYGMETIDPAGADLDTSFLPTVFPKEEDWILYAPYTDKTLLRNDLIMKIGREMGRYHSRMAWCELVLNGEYQGLYQVMEKIKRDKNRVDIAKLTAEDTTGAELTGGYIFKIDKGWDGGWASNYSVVSWPGQPVYFQYVYPQEADLAPQQMNYLQSYVDSFEQAVASPNLHHLSGKHYTEFIDIESFVDNFIHNEISRNVDAYRLSTYFYKDKNQKLVAGPLWDFNLSFGNADYCRGWETSGWLYEEYCDDGNPFWWEKFLQDSLFLSRLYCRWQELRQSVLDTAYLFHYIDSTVAWLDEAQERNYRRWPILGSYVWPNPSPLPADFAEEIAALKQWIGRRWAWIDSTLYEMALVCQPSAAVAPSEGHAVRFWLYPNPGNRHQSRLVWQWEETPPPSMLRVELYASDGRLLAYQPIENPQPAAGLSLDFVPEGLPAGLYRFRLVAPHQGTIAVLNWLYGQ